MYLLTTSIQEEIEQSYKYFLPGKVEYTSSQATIIVDYFNLKTGNKITWVQNQHLKKGMIDETG